MAKHKTYQRWNLQHRLQHGTLAISMFGLLFSGLAIKFHYTAWAQGMFKLMGGFHNNLILHKSSATLLVIVSVWHLVYLLIGWAKERSHPLTWAMMPGINDLRDVVHQMLFLLNLRKTGPQFDRYTYLEKFEYLAIFWGMLVMGLSGFSLWFPEFFGGFLPRTFIDAFRIVHANEAVVALISLAFGHFFTVHFAPGVFPSSSVWYNGQISIEHLAEEHPAEYQRLVERGEIEALSGHHEHKLAGWRRWLAAGELLIYSAVFYYMLITFLPKLLA